MTELIARIGAAKSVELITEKSVQVEDSMTPMDAAYLARGLLSCAAALSGTNLPNAGTIVGDAHLPIMKWSVGFSVHTGQPAFRVSVPPGIELTFQISPQAAKELGAALVAHGDGSAPLAGPTHTIH